MGCWFLVVDIIYRRITLFYILNHGVTHIYFTWNTNLRNTFIGRASMDKKRNATIEYLRIPSFSNIVLFPAFIKRYGIFMPMKKYPITTAPPTIKPRNDFELMPTKLVRS